MFRLLGAASRCFINMNADIPDTVNGAPQTAPPAPAPGDKKSITAADIPGVHKVHGKPGDPVVEVVHEVTEEEILPEEQPAGIHHTVKTLLVGKPLNLDDKSVFSHISLIAVFAWVGLGADGLSSSCYGPE